MVENNNNFALIALVAIVAVVGMVGLIMSMNGHSASTMVVPSESASTAGQVVVDADGNVIGNAMSSKTDYTSKLNDVQMTPYIVQPCGSAGTLVHDIDGEICLYLRTQEK